MTGKKKRGPGSGSGMTGQGCADGALFGGDGGGRPDHGVGQADGEGFDQAARAVEAGAGGGEVAGEVGGAVELDLERLHAAQWLAVAFDNVAARVRIVEDGAVAVVPGDGQRHACDAVIAARSMAIADHNGGGVDAAWRHAVEIEEELVANKE